jgi:ketosteroid isomerase-like protein
MSQENVEIVRQIFDAVTRRDAQGVLALYDPDVVFDASHTEMAGLLGRSVYLGHEGLRTFDREWRETFENVETECDELIEVGDQVISVSRWCVRGREGIETSGLARGGIWTIRHGKVSRVVWFDTREQALQAAGLSEQAMSREELELVARAVRAVTARPKPDFATINDVFHPNHVFVPTVMPLEGKEYHGARGYQQFLGEQGGQMGASHDAPLSWEADFEGAVNWAHIGVRGSRRHWRRAQVSDCCRVWNSEAVWARNSCRKAWEPCRLSPWRFISALSLRDTARLLPRLVAHSGG